MIHLPDDPSPLALADWLEVSLLGQIDEPHRISDTEITGLMDEAGIDPEINFANVRAEIGARIGILGHAYPIVRDGQGFSKRAGWELCLHYTFMLLASLNQHYEELVFKGGTANRPAEIFEWLTGLALQKYVAGKVVRIGAPRREPVPGGFPEAVKYLAAQMAEEFGYGELELQHSGDDAVDLAAWRPQVDRRPSQMIILAQCAIGIDWREKRSDFSEKVWRRHIRWHTDPVPAFAVPFFHEPGNTWRETAVRGGIIFDRARIMSLVDQASIPGELTADMNRWCTERLQQVSLLALG